MTRSYKSDSFKRVESGQFIKDKEGESLSYTARNLANDGDYDAIIDLYESATVDKTAAKVVSNVIFSNAICIVPSN